MSNIKFKPQTRLPGFQDQLGTEVQKEQLLVKTVSQVFESGGFIPLETPPIESMGVITGKGGEETQKLLYKGEGGEWAIRFDLTVPLASFIAFNANQLPDPFKRWQHGFVARGERAQIKKGRLRGFKQLDLDCISTQNNLEDDIDIIVGMVETMAKFTSINYQVRINDRRILDGLCEILGLKIGSSESSKLISLIDKFEKVGLLETLQEAEKVFGQKAQELLKTYLNISGNYQKVINELSSFFSQSSQAQAGINSLKNIGEILTKAGYFDSKSQGWYLDPKIARGLDYYTGTIFETFVVGFEDRGSVFSGGRYDNLVEKLGGPKRFAVGASVGVSRLLSILEDSGEFKDLASGVDVTIAVFPNQNVGELLALAKSLRQAKLITEISTQPQKPLGKQFKAAVARNSRFMIIYGENEKQQGLVRLKKLATEEQFDIKLSELIQFISKDGQ